MKVPTRLKWIFWKRAVGGVAAARRMGVTVGEGCRIISCDVRSEPWLLTIGERVTVSSDVLFITHDGTGWLFADSRGRRFRYAKISIGSDCFIGARAVIMPGVRIEDKCIVAAGAVVTRSVPSGSIVGGNPARVIGNYADFGRKVLSDWHSADDRVGDSYVDLVQSVVEPGFRPSLS